jgi:hypothetical protein
VIAWPVRNTRTATAMKFPAALVDGNARAADKPPPAMLACWTSVIAAVGATVNLTPLLATPPIVTTTFPVVAPAGTGATMLVADQVVGAAVVPLNVTVLVPLVAPKFAPVIVTDAPTAPLAGDSVVIVGAEVTVNCMLLLAIPPAVTTTFPVVAPAGTGTAMLVAPHAAGVAAMPLNVTELAP